MRYKSNKRFGLKAMEVKRHLSAVRGYKHFIFTIYVFQRQSLCRRSIKLLKLLFVIRHMVRRHSINAS